MVAPIPVGGGDMFSLALEAGSIDSIFIFIMHCAFDDFSSVLDWILLLSKFGDNSSLGYSLW
jgi:hypothetical protein